MQIEREREEHLLPRLASSPQSDAPDASVIHIRDDTPDSESSDRDLVIDQKPTSGGGSKLLPLPAVQPAPEPLSPEPLATRSPRPVVAKSPEPMFVGIPAVAMAVPPPAMVAMPTMVPAPSAASNDSLSGPSFAAFDSVSSVPEKPKTSFAGVIKPGGYVSTRRYMPMVWYSSG